MLCHSGLSSTKSSGALAFSYDCSALNIPAEISGNFHTSLVFTSHWQEPGTCLLAREVGKCKLYSGMLWPHIIIQVSIILKVNVEYLATSSGFLHRSINNNNSNRIEIIIFYVIYH